uniref:Uncharacterized protein n=1 Tax=Physcomitrium patens TaxID=3218 RepID=A0A2K1IYR0_PHYPA|nr:hypothetical protein PHYPA_024218 [Physcomitrium patens]
MWNPIGMTESKTFFFSAPPFHDAIARAGEVHVPAEMLMIPAPTPASSSTWWDARIVNSASLL